MITLDFDKCFVTCFCFVLFLFFLPPPETKFLSDPEIIQTGLERQPLVPDKTDIVSNICSMLPHTTAPLC